MEKEDIDLSQSQYPISVKGNTKIDLDFAQTS